jgi:hypothetical protein
VARALPATLELLAVAAALWLVHVFGRTLPTTALAAIWAATTLGLASALLRRARIRRAVARRHCAAAAPGTGACAAVGS